MRQGPIKIVLTYIVALLPGVAGLILLALPLYDVWVLVCAGVLVLFSCVLLMLMRYCLKLEADYTKRLQVHDEEAAQREKAACAERRGVQRHHRRHARRAGRFCRRRFYRLRQSRRAGDFGWRHDGRVSIAQPRKALPFRGGKRACRRDENQKK